MSDLPEVLEFDSYILYRNVDGMSNINNQTELISIINNPFATSSVLGTSIEFESILTVKPI